jgi:large subunit ribosomal protein L6
MSRIAGYPITVPEGVQVTINGADVAVKGPKGELAMTLHPLIAIDEADGVLKIRVVRERPEATALAGTMRALVNNMVTGVSQGFEKRLSIVGVGYRAQAQGQKVNLSVGYSHPVVYDVPAGVTAETPSPTEIVVRGADKQLVGQTAAEIRAWRPPEPYKGKGVRYADEHVVRKQAKKK